MEKRGLKMMSCETWDEMEYERRADWERGRLRGKQAVMEHVMVGEKRLQRLGGKLGARTCGTQGFGRQRHAESWRQRMVSAAGAQRRRAKKKKQCETVFSERLWLQP